MGDTRFSFVLPQRNVGAGIAVLHSWRRAAAHLRADDPQPDAFRCLTRDLLVGASRHRRLDAVKSRS